MAEINPSSLLTITKVLQPYMPVFYVSFGVTLILTPLMRFLAHRHGVVDEPDNKRKVHTLPVAYLGGIATFLGWLAGVSVSVLLPPHNADPSVVTGVMIPPGVIIGAVIVVLFGLLDDVYSISPKLKLIGQALAAIFLIMPGWMNGGGDFFLGVNRGTAWMIITPMNQNRILFDFATLSPVMRSYIITGAMIVSVLIAVFIIISTCNATNLLDGLDGLCSGVTAVMALGYLFLAVYLATQSLGTSVEVGEQLDPIRIVLSLALLGAVLGFLPFNFNPASIFMGDTGSMFLGYMCGTMMLLFGQHGMIRWFLASVVIFGLPMLDTLLAIVRRKLNGKPIFSPDSNHLHHFLVKRGYSVKKAVFISYGIAAMFVSFALLIVVLQTRIAMGIYMVLFGWLVVAAFKMGIIFQQKTPPAVNATLNAAVLTMENGSAEKNGTAKAPEVVLTAANKN